MFVRIDKNKNSKNLRCSSPLIFLHLLLHLRMQDALRKGFDNMMKNFSAWDHYSNDGDVCCTDQEAAVAAGHGSSNQSWLVWGASTQGRPCGIYAPNQSAAKHDSQVCCTNAVATYDGTADELLVSFFT
jgi:hypothetical protein